MTRPIPLALKRLVTATAGGVQPVRWPAGTWSPANRETPDRLEIASKEPGSYIADWLGLIRALPGKAAIWQQRWLHLAAKWTRGG